MARRPGWAALSVLAWALAGLAVVGAVGGSIVAASNRDLGAILLTLVGGAMVATFWRWIALGAWYRSDGRIETSPVGPWGWVGRILTASVVGGLLALVIWAEVSTRDDEDRAERFRADVEEAANDARLTLADVERVERAYGNGRLLADDPLVEGLLDLPDSTVIAVAVIGDEGRILVSPDEEPMGCVVATVDAAGVIDAVEAPSCAVRPQ